ncbi:MAG: RCC1-like domain-containing protein [Solirubrobacteraceae bacterium]
MRQLIHRRVIVCPLSAAAAFAIVACAGGGAQAASGHRAAAPRTPVYRFGVVGNRGKIAKLELHRPTLVRGIAGRVVQIATSNSDGYALTSSGAVWAWGVGGYGELGNGKTPPYSTRAVQVRFPAGVRITRLANPMPFDDALAIDSHGHAWGWGLDASGDLCQTALILARPARLPLDHVTLATGARTHSLLDSNGTVYACGNGEGGALGTGSFASSSTPVRVVALPAGQRVTALVSSWEGSGALLANGAYYDWGFNAAGQLGDRTTTNSAVPVRVALPAPVKQVFQGGSGPKNGQTIVLLRNASVWAWGNGIRGQLGDGTRQSSAHPVRVKLPRGFRTVTVNSGGYASYAIDGFGRLWDWGGNQNGQLGTGGRRRGTDIPQDTGIHVEQISSTASNVAALGR